MKYDSRKTLFENKILLNESDPQITFMAPHPSAPTQIVKWTTNGKILSKVSQNISFLEKSTLEGDRNPILSFDNGKKHLYYDDGKQLSHYKEYSLEQCIEERFAGGKGGVKSWDHACLGTRTETLNSLEKSRFKACLSTITNNQKLMNMPFAIEKSGQKVDQYGESENGTYKIWFKLIGEDCSYGGFNYYYDNPNFNSFLNYEHPLKPLKPELVKNQQQKPIVKKVEQKVEKPKLTLDQQKKWCQEHGKVWSDEVNACVGKEITLDSSKMEIQTKDDKDDKDDIKNSSSSSKNVIGVKGNSTSSDKGASMGYIFDLD